MSTSSEEAVMSSRAAILGDSRRGALRGCKGRPEPSVARRIYYSQATPGRGCPCKRLQKGRSRERQPHSRNRGAGCVRALRAPSGRRASLAVGRPLTEGGGLPLARRPFVAYSSDDAEAEVGPRRLRGRPRRTTARGARAGRNQPARARTRYLHARVRLAVGEGRADPVPPVAAPIGRTPGRRRGRARLRGPAVG